MKKIIVRIRNHALLADYHASFGDRRRSRYHSRRWQMLWSDVEAIDLARVSANKEKRRPDFKDTACRSFKLVIIKRLAQILFLRIGSDGRRYQKGLTN